MWSRRRELAPGVVLARLALAFAFLLPPADPAPPLSLSPDAARFRFARAASVAAALAAKTCDGAAVPGPRIVRERKAPIGMRLQREKSERAEGLLEEVAPPSVAVASASVSSEDPQVLMAEAKKSSSSTSRTDS